jgi:hypothetical protein
MVYVKISIRLIDKLNDSLAVVAAERSVSVRSSSLQSVTVFDFVWGCIKWYSVAKYRSRATGFES